ncbi:ribulokinase [Haloglycomyces albus]|uniref:ribulokinase n=1 Tax=Haloglycomyces albus TaxID=526067 RepID=UPI0004A27849|nr:ribulokinase [Haloglycomyces albus]
MTQAVIGIDFGTLSGRVLVVDTTGKELASVEQVYKHGSIEQHLPDTDIRLGSSWALQDPDDWRDVLRLGVPKALKQAGISANDIVGIATDFTACTVLPVTGDGTPLCELAEFRGRPHAWPKLWKHHAAQDQADRVSELAHARGEDWIRRYGGKISSEWEFAKALQILEEDPEIYRRMDRWIEAADWIVWQLMGSENRNICTAGYKGQYQDGAWPSKDYLSALHPEFTDFAKSKLEFPLSPLGSRAGGITTRAAEWTGLRIGTPVAVGNVDAHVTASAAQAVDPGHLVAIMGTSTCHVVNAELLSEVPGMCGVVRDGIVPGLWGFEAGQSGVGDIFAWFVKNGVPDSYTRLAEQRGMSIHDYLSKLAAEENVGEHGLIALDWHSGNRSILVDHDLTGVLVGLSLHTRPEQIYRALLESTAFGTRKIIDTLTTFGVPINEITVAGGLLKNKLLMQIYADVLNRPLNVLTSTQGPALGSAIHAAVAADVYPDIQTASAEMGDVERGVYRPDPDNVTLYDDLYNEYCDLHDHFGRQGSRVLHRLREISRKASQS